MSVRDWRRILRIFRPRKHRKNGRRECDASVVVERSEFHAQEPSSNLCRKFSPSHATGEGWRPLVGTRLQLTLNPHLAGGCENRATFGVRFVITRGEV